MKKLSLGGAMLAVVMAAPAVAADLPIEAPAYVERPPAIGLWNWTGFYIGGNAGYVRSSGSVDISAFSVPNTGGAPLLSLSETMGGLAGGVQAGANWQTGNAVFGIEADFQGTSGLGTASFSNFQGGSTLGGGVEFALADAWTVKAEYLFLQSTTISNTPFVARPDVLVNTKIRENLFRVGVNYAFFTGSVGCRPHDC
jgi:opacity protein-like surface antigen